MSFLYVHLFVGARSCSRTASSNNPIMNQATSSDHELNVSFDSCSHSIMLSGKNYSYWELCLFLSSQVLKAMFFLLIQNSIPLKKNILIWVVSSFDTYSAEIGFCQDQHSSFLKIFSFPFIFNESCKCVLVVGFKLSLKYYFSYYHLTSRQKSACLYHCKTKKKSNYVYKKWRNENKPAYCITTHILSLTLAQLYIH